MPYKNIEDRNRYRREIYRRKKLGIDPTWLPRSARVKVSKTLHKKISRQKATQDTARFLWEYKCVHPCEKCKYSHPAALDFHHRNPEEKSRHVSSCKTKVNK